MKSYVKVLKRFISTMLILFMLVGILCENPYVAYASQTLSWIVKPQYNYDDVQPLIDIYRQESVVKTLTAKKTSFTQKKLTKGKKYFFKARTYRTVNGKKVYSTWSKIKSVKVK